MHTAFIQKYFHRHETLLLILRTLCSYKKFNLILSILSILIYLIYIIEQLWFAIAHT